MQTCPRGCLQNLVSNFWTFLLVSMNFGSLNYFFMNFTKSKRKEKMKPGTGPWIRPKTTVLGCGMGWRPTVAVGCHGVAAHRAAWLGRRSGPQGARARRAHGRDGARSVPAGSRARARGRWEGAPSKMRNGAAHRGGRALVTWHGEADEAAF
jgi:hypothetical protein